MYFPRTCSYSYLNIFLSFSLPASEKTIFSFIMKLTREDFKQRCISPGSVVILLYTSGPITSITFDRAMVKPRSRFCMGVDTSSSGANSFIPEMSLNKSITIHFDFLADLVAMLLPAGSAYTT